MPTNKGDYTIPPGRIRGYAELAPQYGDQGTNIAAHFCHSIVGGLTGHGFLDPELQARLPKDQVRAQLAPAFDKVGAWPCDYDFERIILVLCDDSVRQPGPDAFGWPDFLPPKRRRVILELSWKFPKPHSEIVPCTFWISADGPSLCVCKFVNEKVDF